MELDEAELLARGLLPFCKYNSVRMADHTIMFRGYCHELTASRRTPVQVVTLQVAMALISVTSLTAIALDMCMEGALRQRLWWQP